jgi:hypothetical protein
MVRDEAPAATLRGFQRKWDVDRLECGLGHVPGFNSRNGPASFVAAEIHL